MGGLSKKGGERSRPPSAQLTWTWTWTYRLERRDPLGRCGPRRSVLPGLASRAHHVFFGPMKVVAGRAALAASGQARSPTAFVIGNFDGVHLGHQALLQAARDRAAATGGDVGVLTFDPHPAKL